ncbi:MAG: hypothetical protein IKQ16_01135 [Lentisphaeria bacterium]|nr:hypothetical protein [Lentisphaeria bacterium]
MFVDDIRAILNPDSGLDCKKELLRQYAAAFRNCSGALSEWPAKQDRGAEDRAEAWKLFHGFCRIALELAVSRGKGVYELESAKPLANSFLSVLFPGKDYADEIESRLDYIAKRAFDAAWNRNEDPFSPMDGLDPFRQMLCRHLEETAEAKRAVGKKTNRSTAGISIETQLLKIEYEQTRHQPGSSGYGHFESLHESALCVLKELGRNAAPDAHPRFKLSSAWEIRAALKDHVPLTEADSPVRRRNPTWETVCSLKIALCQSPEQPERERKKQPPGKLPPRNRN